MKKPTNKAFRKIIQKYINDIQNDFADCSSCCICCIDEELTLTQQDIFRISKHLKIDKKNFIEKYTNKNEIHRLICMNMPCPFLKNNRCEIYSIRPQMCQNYPIFVKEDNVFVQEIEACPLSTHFIESFIEFLHETNIDHYNKLVEEYDKPADDVDLDVYVQNSVLPIYVVYLYLGWYHNIEGGENET